MATTTAGTGTSGGLGASGWASIAGSVASGVGAVTSANAVKKAAETNAKATDATNQQNYEKWLMSRGLGAGGTTNTMYPMWMHAGYGTSKAQARGLVPKGTATAGRMGMTQAILPGLSNGGQTPAWASFGKQEVPNVMALGNNWVMPMRQNSTQNFAY